MVCLQNWCNVYNVQMLVETILIFCLNAESNVTYVKFDSFL